MKVLICYDIKSNKLCRKLVKYLERIAVRIQYSVFISDLTKKEIEKLNCFARKLLAEEGNESFKIFNVAASSNNSSFDVLPQNCIIF